eukprot:TRINITY_DN39_c3_g1_i1.p1 TRINITY_DN39_c3_g1~~TRINITY_DN39_c3_g1_i1.p1  ORF type:complete len:314 (-),score=77.41 TRINITY_DN39_c3_g1_i1:208-1149(-)
MDKRFSVIAIFVLYLIICIESRSVTTTTYDSVIYQTGENYYLTGFCLLMPSIPISGEYEAFVKYEFEENVKSLTALYPYNDGDKIDMDKEYKLDEQEGSKNIVVYQLHTMKGEDLHNWVDKYYRDFSMFNGLVLSPSRLKSVTFEVRSEYLKDVDTEGEECLIPDSHFYFDHSLGFINFESEEEEEDNTEIYEVNGLPLKSSDNPTNDIYYFTTGYNIFMVVCLISSLMLCCITLCSICSRVKKQKSKSKYDPSPVQNFEYFYDHHQFPTVNLKQSQEVYLIQPFVSHSDDSSDLTFETVFTPGQQQTLYPQI